MDDTNRIIYFSENRAQGHKFGVEINTSVGLSLVLILSSSCFAVLCFTLPFKTLFPHLH